MEQLLAFVGSEAVVGVIGLIGGYIVNRYLVGDSAKVFDIWADAILDTFEELELDENQKTAVFYKLLKKIHKAPAKTAKAEKALLDKVEK